MFNIELASTTALKFVGPLSDVAILGPMTVEVNQNAGNSSAKAIPDPFGTKRIHPATTRVTMKLTIRQRSTSRVEKLSPSQDTSSYFLAKRSKSAIWRSISSRAESEAERIP
jgi:hypothetical protein